MKNKETEESIKRIKGIVDFYKLNDENNYDYSDDVLISMKNLLSYIEQLEKRNKQLYDGFMATQEELTDYATKNEQLENNRDKAIEYINNLKNYRFEFTFDSVDRHEIVGCEKNFVKDLLNILKGDSDDE